ncbi:MAG: flavodoxin [Desulfobacterales bacterium]|nr:flavodoxin domain-containing protein [Deltaproteobacteria bacterium]NNL43171.1 flavodoxin [Desulfobacterales bacterium]
MKKITRREFIIDGTMMTAGALGAITLGSDVLLTEKAQAANVIFPESNCGSENNRGNRILVTYASQCGTTGEVGEAIGKVLCENGATVETIWIKNVKNLNHYDGVIIGSAIQKSRWMSEAIEFVKTNQNVLSKIPVAYFLTCLTLYRKTEKARRKAIAFLDPLYAEAPQVKPISVGRFAGVLDYSRLSFIYRTVMKRKMKKWGIPEGDYRDWDAIRSWAKDIRFKLLNERS